MIRLLNYNFYVPLQHIYLCVFPVQGSEGGYTFY